MDPKPRRQIPKVAMLVVPLVTLGLAITVVSLAWRSSRVQQNDPSAAATGPVPTEIGNAIFLACTDCHQDLDKVFKQGGVTNLLYRHEKHFAEGVSECAVCHPANTHEPDTINTPSMSRCFICHGLGPDAIAPGICSTCHPSGMPKQPESHLSDTWASKDHPAEAKEDRFQCLTCHEQKTCDSCHGLPIPHPDGWKEQAHAASYFDDPGVCTKCHPTRAASSGSAPTGRTTCDTCHHPSGPEDTLWLRFHPQVVKSDGASTCFTCHATDTCATCHKTGTFDPSADQQLFIQNEGGTASPAA
jgi:hypothetical protein